MDYVVYAHIAKDIDGYAYIGMGDKNRPRSSWRRSDKRHIELIENNELEVVILSHHDTKEDAFMQERHMIRMHRPYFNKMMYNNNFQYKPSKDLTRKEILMRKRERAVWWKRRELEQQTV